MTAQQEKVLWGRSGGRCASCKDNIVAESKAGKAFPLAEQAHMTARKPGGPRGNPQASKAEREDSANYILLCPNCHTAVDKAAEDWPLERLRQLKADHEEWVSNLGEQAPMAEVAGIIDVVGSNADLVEGLAIEAPTRMKHGTRVFVQGQNAPQVTGVRIGRPSKGDRE